MKKPNNHKKNTLVSEIINPFNDIPDRTEEILKQAREGYSRVRNQQEADRKQREIFKQNRILAAKIAKINEYTHAIDTILEWIEKGKDPNGPIDYGENPKSCTIDYYHFNFEDRFDIARNLFEPFLNKLKDTKCFLDWKRQTLVGRSQYTFIGVDSNRLKEYKKNFIIDDIQPKSSNDTQNFIDPDKMKWYDKKRDEYQFGSKIFTQSGKKRNKVFVALMDAYETNSEQKLFIQNISKTIHITPDRVRIEINAINVRLRKEVGMEFLGSRKGYYTLKHYNPQGQKQPQ